MPLQKIIIKEMDSVSFFRELERFWQPAKHLRTLFVNLLFLAIFVMLGFVLTHQKFHFALPDHFGEVADLECGVQLSGKGHLNHQITNSLHKVLNVSSLDSAISLDKSKILKNLLLSKSLDEVNLCARPTSTQGEPTSQQLTQSDNSERFHYDDEMDILMQHLDSQKLRINPSPNSGDFMEDLSHELQFADSDQSLLDLFGSASQKNDVIYQENCQFDFTAGHLIPERLKEFGMKKDVLDFVKSGIPVHLDSPLYPGDIKPK